MNCYFIRHGEIASNRIKVYSGRSDEALTDAGRQQVKAARDQLAALDIDAIFCSPLTRTRETAAILVEQLDWNLPLHIDDSFNEIKMGPWEGRSEADVASRYPEQWTLWNTRPADLELQGRETLQQLQDRVLDGLRRIDRDYEYESILIVTHVAVIRTLSLYANGLELNRYKSVPVANAEVFTFGNLGIFQGSA